MRRIELFLYSTFGRFTYDDMTRQAQECLNKFYQTKKNVSHKLHFSCDNDYLYVVVEISYDDED